MLYTAKEIKDLRKRLGLTQLALANRLEIRPETIWRWEQHGVSDNADARCVDALRRLMQSE